MESQVEPETFLALLADSDREALLGLGRSRRYRPGEHLMNQGELGDPVLLLRERR